MLEIGIQNLKLGLICSKKYLAILFKKKHTSTHLWRMEWTNKKTVNPFTASYYEEEKKPLNSKKPRFQRLLSFRRTLVKGKIQCMQYS
jgi:hypothetical protein